MSAYESIRYKSFHCSFTKLEINLHVVNDWSKANVHRNSNHNFKARLCYIYFRVIVDFDPNSIYLVPLTWSLAFDPPPFMQTQLSTAQIDLGMSHSWSVHRECPNQSRCNQPNTTGSNTPHHKNQTQFNFPQKTADQNDRLSAFFFFNHC